MKRILNAFIKAFFPQRCAYCGRVISQTKLMCDECKESLPRINGEICRKCGVEKKECCCRNAEKYFECITAPFYFSGKVRSGIHSFKFRNAPDNAEAYAYEMSEAIKERFSGIEFDFITEVPMTQTSILKRGYNQCALLAKQISNNLGIEYKNDVLIKLYETEKQHNLKHFLRKGNLTGVFDVCNPVLVENKTILLCDDISTTGETLNECAKMLWLYGAKEIYCVSVALTHNKKK